MDFDWKKISPLVVWELTLKCNLNCLHCGSSAGAERVKELTTEEALSLVDDFAEINVDEVCLMGGEPLIRKDWYKIAKKIRDSDMRIDLITNGCHDNRDEIIKKLVTLDPFAVAVSIDGGTEETHDFIRRKGSFKKATGFLFALKDANLPPTIITTVSKLNYKELPKIRDMILGQGIAWQIQIASPIGRFNKKYALSEEEFYAVGKFIASMKEEYSPREMPVAGAHDLGYNSQYMPCLGLYPDWRGCPAGILTFGVRSNGGIIGCLSCSDKYLEGNIREKSLFDIWNDTNSFSYNRNFKENDLGVNCKDCKFGISCKGGCSSQSTARTGQLHNDPLCFYKIEQEYLKKGEDPQKLDKII
jgi:radical SAM protein with 4Fe4S-binding SPASM domain